MKFHFFKYNPLLWQFVGEDPYILTSCSKLTRIRFSIIGLIVLIVVLVSGLSIFFGVYEVLESEIFGVILGIYSALFFLVLYIFILYTLNKKVLPTNDPTSLGRLISYCIRIGFLVLLGLITYQPIAYECFSDFVNDGLSKDIYKSIEAKRTSLNRDYTIQIESIALAKGLENVSTLEILELQGEKNRELKAFAKHQYERNFFIQKLLLLEEEWYMWTGALLFICFFISPVYLRMLISSGSMYYQTKKRVQMGLIESHYAIFVNSYNKTIQRYSTTKSLQWYTPFVDAPYNTKLHPSLLHKTDEDFTQWLLDESI